MGGLLVLPVASWALPAWQIPILPPERLLPVVAEAAGRPMSVPESVSLRTLPSRMESIPPFEPALPAKSPDQATVGSESSVPLFVESMQVPAIVEPAAPPWTTIEWISLLVSVGWSLGVALFGVLLLVGLWRTVKLRQTSLVVSEGVWPGMLVDLRQRLGLSRSVELREHAQSVVPLTWGILRPVVLLPKLARAWDEPMRRAVLLHELAHVQRGDVACQVLGRVTCAQYWFHPLAWFALRQLRQEREQACDDAVVQSGEKASDYAEQLLQVARLCCAPRGLSLGVAMAEGSSLERRVLSLFDSARSHGPLTRRVAITSFLIGGAIVAGLAPLEPTASQAEPTASDAMSLKEARDDDPKSTSNDTKPKSADSEYPFSLELCHKVFSDPVAFKQLDQLKPLYGNPMRGIQLGLAINSLSRSFAVGDRLPLMLVYRNVGQKELTFHISQDHWNDPPTVIDQNGHQVPVSFVMHWMFIAPLKITLKPGDAFCEMTSGLCLGEPMPSIKPVVGRYRLNYPQAIWDVNTTPQLRTDLLALPTTIPDTSLPNEKSPKEPEPAPSVPAAQLVETPTWSESLTTGTIEFEISPSDSGALEARLLAMHDDSIPMDGDANMVAIDNIWWGEPVDGLEPGLWLTETEDSRNLRIPMDSLAKYRVVVRNTTNSEIEFLVRLLPFDGQDAPYLIPSDKLDAKGKIVAPQPAKEFQAQGTATVLSAEDPAYIITLAAGESSLVPGEFGLYVGKAPDERYPQIANFVPGTHWIVQPLLVHPLADKERAELNRLLGEFQVTKIDRSGKTRQEPVVRVEAPDDSMGKYAYARYHLEVGTLDASADRNANAAIWGEVEKGMQCGIRIMNPQPSYKIGDTLEAEVLWRNASDAVISTSRPRQLDLYPIIEAAEGQQLQIDFGARYRLIPFEHDFQPGEVRSLGVTKITLVTQGIPGPKDNKEPGHIMLQPGEYKLSASGGVGNISPWSGKYEFTVELADATVDPLPKAPENSARIRGQIINEDQLGVPNAEVLIVGGTDWNRSIEGHVIAQGITDAKGEFAIPITESELQNKPWGQVWRRAPGYAAARGNSVQSLESLMEKPLTYGPLVKTDGLQLVVHDPAGKPQPGVRVEALSVRVNQGIGYALPALWRDDNSGISDAEGKVHLPYIDPGSVDRLELSVVGHTAATQFGPNYFLNYRPQETAPHFIFPTVETGVLEGRLVPAPGVTLPKGLKIPLKTLTGKVDVSGAHDVSVDDEGRFRVPDMPAGEISVLQFLDDEQPLRPWISERAYVKAGMTTQLEIPIVMGTRVSGRVQKSDTKLGVADYEFEVYYGPAIKFRGSDLWLLKHPVKADADGKYELYLPPGPINLRLTRYVDGYNDATSWLPREKRGSLGPLHEIPAQADFELPPVELVKMLPIVGTLVDQNDKPLADDDWSVYGYPEIPGEEERFVMNSMAGVETNQEGRFEGSYPEPYPPVRWKVSHRVWKTKYEFDDIKFRVDIAQESPLILRVDTTKPLSGNDRE
jgi:beta-lactamase regulating signal transducer with metallopeptidase domain